MGALLFQQIIDRAGFQRTGSGQLFIRIADGKPAGIIFAHPCIGIGRPCIITKSGHIHGPDIKAGIAMNHPIGQRQPDTAALGFLARVTRRRAALDAPRAHALAAGTRDVVNAIADVPLLRLVALCDRVRVWRALFPLVCFSSCDNAHPNHNLTSKPRARGRRACAERTERRNARV